MFCSVDPKNPSMDLIIRTTVQLHPCLFILIKKSNLSSRPKSVEEVAYQDEVIAVLKKCLEGSDVSSVVSYPHSVNP